MPRGAGGALERGAGRDPGGVPRRASRAVAEPGGIRAELARAALDRLKYRPDPSTGVRAVDPLAVLVTEATWRELIADVETITGRAIERGWSDRVMAAAVRGELTRWAVGQRRSGGAA